MKQNENGRSGASAPSGHSPKGGAAKASPAEPSVPNADATEAELRDAKVPWPKTIEELTAYIGGLVERPHDYGTCVYAMSMSAVAAFYYASHKLGVTGFQASCADLDFLRRTRNIERFVITDIGNALYPQYDLVERLKEALDEAKPWLAEQARAKLTETDCVAHPDVVRHWRELAEQSA